MSVAKPAPPKILAQMKIAAPISVLACAILAGRFLGPAFAVLVLAGGALIAVIALFWSSLRTLLGETPLSGADAYAIGATRAEEEQKQAVLRALKDLEFERSVGKISEEDYQELVAKYRAEAKRLLRVLEADAQPRRARVEDLVAKHLHRAGVATRLAAIDTIQEDEDQGEAEPEAEPPPVAQDRACASCGTLNDEDAVFCKKCGARQHQDSEASDTDDEDEQPRGSS